MKLTSFLLALGAFFLKGYVFMTVWNWFPAQIFNITELNYVSALGLSVALIFAKNLDLEPKEKDDEQLVAEGIAVIIFLFFVLGVGFIINAFM